VSSPGFTGAEQTRRNGLYWDEVLSNLIVQHLSCIRCPSARKNSVPTVQPDETLGPLHAWPKQTSSGWLYSAESLGPRRQRLCCLRQAPYPNAYDTPHRTRHEYILDTISVHLRALIDPIPTDTSEDAPVVNERSRSGPLRLALAAQKCTQCAVAATGLAEIIDFKVE
jgi:hypothetical protein